MSSGPGLRALALSLAATTLFALATEGRVTDGRHGLPGVRVSADRLPRVHPTGQVPTTLTDAEGRFRLELQPSDTVLAVEKDGWRRDLIPAPEWSREIVLRAEPGFHEEAVCLVRLDFPDRSESVV